MKTFLEEYLEERKSSVFLIQKDDGEIIHGTSILDLLQERNCETGLFKKIANKEHYFFYIKNTEDIPFLLGEKCYPNGELYRYENEKHWISIKEEIAFFKKNWKLENIPMICDYVSDLIENYLRILN